MYNKRDGKARDVPRHLAHRITYVRKGRSLEEHDTPVEGPGDCRTNARGEIATVGTAGCLGPIIRDARLMSGSGGGRPGAQGRSSPRPERLLLLADRHTRFLCVMGSSGGRR